MGKTGKWIKNLLSGKREKEKEREKESKIETHHPQISANNGYDQRPATPQPTTPKEKRRWSFRRSSAASPGKHDDNTTTTAVDRREENDNRKHALVVAAAAAAKAAAAVIQLTAAASCKTTTSAVEEAAATKIQSVFRAYLARKALNALRGLVKLQALVRGHLVRKQATATLRCMQALVNAQARTRAQRLRMVAEETKYMDQKQYNHRKSTQENRFRNSNQDFGIEENIKIVEMDLGDYKPVTKARNSYSNHTQPDRTISAHRSSIKQEHHHHQQISPAPSALTDISPRTCSNHFEDCSYATAQSSPQCYSSVSKPDPASYPRSEYAESESLYNEYPFYPNYMANTESSRAKVRSHSAPKQRPVETFERQPSRRRPSIEGRNVPRAVRMQRSSSHVGSAAQNYQYPWSVKLDKSVISIKDSECGSTSTVLTNTNYCRSLVGFDVQGARY